MSGIWPGDTRCVAMLTFDLDGVSAALNRNPDAGKHPSLVSSREYGPSVAAHRILDLLDQYHIKSSFYIPGYIAETHEELVVQIKERGHEIAHHGYIHEPPSSLSKDQEIEVLDKGIEIIERITGEKPLGYRSPSWELSEYSLSLMSERGFLYDSSLMGDDAPYVVDADGTKMVEVPVHWELDDFPYFNFTPVTGSFNLMASPQHVYDVWSAAFEGAHHYGRAFTLTMHPHCIGRPGRLRMLERLIQYINGFPNVEYMRVIDAARLFDPNPK